MIWWMQLRGLVATGLLAAVGIAIIVGGFAGASQSTHKWADRVGYLIIGMVFIVPFMAVLVSVWMSRMH